MKEIHQYVCEVCGKTYETEEACLKCEWEHKVKELKDEIFLYDAVGKPIELTEPADFENAFYIHWTTGRANDFLIETLEEYYGTCNGIEKFIARDTGFIYYNDSYYKNCWDDFEALEAEVNRIRKEIFNQGDKIPLDK